jgi:hypothetical protein
MALCFKKNPVLFELAFAPHFPCSTQSKQNKKNELHSISFFIFILDMGTSRHQQREYLRIPKNQVMRRFGGDC